MRLADYSPVASPSLEQQRDALQKGMGRSMQWAMAGHLDEPTLLDACLNDKRFDRQCEDSRGDWLWQIVQVLHAEGRFRSTILDAVQNLTDVYTAEQLCELALHYAFSGDDAFRSCLYQIVEVRPFDDIPWLIDWPVFELDGEKGFLFAARMRGQQLAKREWEWDDEYFLDKVSERLGKSRVDQLLGATTDDALNRYRDAWLQRKKESKEATNPCQDHAERMRQIPIAEIIAAAKSPESKYLYFRGWGRWANEIDLTVVLERLLSCDEPIVIANYLKVFSGRVFPRIVPKLISFARHEDLEVRRRAIVALENNSHPLIRDFAVQELAKVVPEGLALGLFIKNYEEGDEQRIFESIELPDDHVQLHWLLMDAVKLLKTNPQADCSKLGLVAYASTPCGNCRGSAARLLRDSGAAPSWLIEECRFDSEADTRKLLSEPTQID